MSGEDADERSMARPVPALIVLALAIFTVGFAQARSLNVDPGYSRANAQLAHTVPGYPRARLLVRETIHGEVGTTPFEAVQTIYFLSSPVSQFTINRFYAQRLGKTWRRQRRACLVAGRKLVVAVVSTRTRRLGVLVDSRGASRCYDLTGAIGDLLDLGYP